MSRESGPDARLKKALTEGLPSRAPDDLLQVVAERTAGRPQRPTSRWAWLRTPFGRRVAVAAIAAVALGLVVLRAEPRNVAGGPSPAGTVASVYPRPSIPSDGSCEPGVVCQGLLPAGSVSSLSFEPSLVLRVPAGWMNRDDRAGMFELRPIGAPGDVIWVYREPEPVQAGRLVSGVAQRAQSLADFLARDPEVVASGADPVTVGGLAGVVVDISVAPEAARSSADCPGIRCISVFAATDKAQRPVWAYRLAIPATSRARMYLLDAPVGVVLITVLAWDGASFDDVTALARPIVESMRFGP